MLNWIIKASLHNRVLVLIAAHLVSVYGVYVTLKTPTDVLPDLNRPAVTIFGEAPGLAPEEVEAQVIDHCASCLAGFKVPKGVVFVDSLPKNPSGKLLKRDLRGLHARLFQP